MIVARHEVPGLEFGHFSVLLRRRCRCVPEGRCDRSLARSAWNSVTPKEPSRRARSDSCRCAHRFDDWNDEILIEKNRME
jgi:hypothetical protein